MNLSIILVNWNSSDYLRSCLTSVYRETQGIEFEVIVVDNASYDGSEKMLNDYFPGVKFVQSQINLGFSRANNLGYSLSRGSILLFLNPDTEVKSDAISKMITGLRADSSAGAAGGRLLNTDESLQTSCVQSFPTLLNQILDLELLRRMFPNHAFWGMRALYSQSPNPVSVDAISGACFMIRRSVFEEIGRFSEGYFMYAEDLDLSYRIRKAGYKIIYINKSIIIHHGGKSSSRQNENFSDIKQRESMAQFFLCTRGRVYTTVYRLALAGVAVARIGFVVCAFALGAGSFQGKGVGSIIKKWSKISLWAVGLYHLSGNTQK